MVYTRIRLLLLFVPLFFIFSFSDIQTKIFVTLFSGTVRPRRLKFGAHVDNRWMCPLYRNQAAAAYFPFIFSFFFLSNFQTLKCFCHTFLRNCEALKVETLYPRGQWVDESCIPNVFITFFSSTARHKKLKQYKVTNLKNKYNVLCILKSGCSYFFILLFLPFSVSPLFSFYKLLCGFCMISFSYVFAIHSFFLTEKLNQLFLEPSIVSVKPHNSVFSCVRSKKHFIP